MTFGKIKSLIEKNLIESYKNESEFKKTIREFKQNVLNDRSLSKAYAVYDQLSAPQGLSEQDAREFLDEGISLLQKVLPSIKLPRTLNESVTNNYSDIDTLVYTKNINLKDRLTAKKNILSVLTKSNKKINESINIPVSSMIKIANQALFNYVETLDENSKKEFIQIISEDAIVLEKKFNELRENTIQKLNVIMESESQNDVKFKIKETIEKLKTEKFDQLNYLRLKDLESSI